MAGKGRLERSEVELESYCVRVPAVAGNAAAIQEKSFERVVAVGDRPGAEQERRNEVLLHVALASCRHRTPWQEAAA
jgi:hypothetical protein